MSLSYRSILLALVLSFFGSEHAQTEATGPESIILIVADHSGSMHKEVTFMNGYVRLPTHMSIQTAAINAAIDDYLSSCNDLTLGYLMWGSNPTEPIWVDLDDKTERTNFQERLKETFSKVNLTDTEHLYAWDKASRSVTERQADVAAVIFITDQPGKEVALRMPPDTIIYKIGIEQGLTNYVQTYLKTKMAPGQGVVYSVSSDTALKAVIDQVMHEVGTQLCVG